MSELKFKEKLHEQLKKDDRLWNEDKTELNQILLLDLVKQYDKKLIELLFNNLDIRNKFFTQINNAYVFNMSDFKFFLEENKVNNSYTSYSNRIGLFTNNNFIKNLGKVVLNFPYKDCVLQGEQKTSEGEISFFEYDEDVTKTQKKKGMKKESYNKKNESRNEIFFNQVLAQDEIDRLYDEKTFTNWKKYSKNGEIEFDKLKRDKNKNLKDNFIIKGNNLLALHSLKNQFRNQIKTIYLDPPYNTKNDEFKYNDNFSRSTWLTFMKNRLEVAKKLLAEDGAIFVQCDDNEQAYLKVLMDEIFGEENFRECIAVKMGSESGVNAINVMRGEQLFKVKEYILYYSKNNDKHRFNPLYVKGMSYNYSYRYEVIKNNGTYEVTNVYKQIIRDNFNQETLRGLSKEEKLVFYTKFEEYCLENSENIYALKRDIQKSGARFKKFAKANKKKGIVEEYQTSDGRTTLVYKGGMLSSLDERIVEENGDKHYGLLISDFWWDIGATPHSEGNVELKSGKKPEKLIKRIIDLTTEEGDIVLDFFLGSGTTAAVAHKMNRQYIGIEQLDYGENSAMVRLNNVLDGDQTGISTEVNWQGGGNFIYTELAKWNEKAIEKIKQCKDLNELKDLFDNLYNKYFLNYNVRIKEFKEEIIDEKEFKNLSLEEQKKIFAFMLDLNQLYIQKSEMEDNKYNISRKDQKLTKKFYQED